jgi:hypothetical protein
VAIYLTNTLRVALDTEWHAYWKANGKTSKTSARTARTNFMRGMVWRLSERLREMKKAQGQANANNCRAIVLAKTRLVSEAYKASGIKPRIGYRSSSMADGRALHAGVAAGDRVSISSGALPNASTPNN